MNALLDAPDKSTSQGWRDYTLLLFLYNTGARADEAATLLIRDLSLPKRKGLAVVTITGKGNKTRRCPLWQHAPGCLLRKCVLFKFGTPECNLFVPS